MDPVTSILPTTLFGWIATILTTAASVTFIFSKIRSNDLQILRDSNADLRLAHSDNVKLLESMKQEIEILKNKVKVLEHANKTLEDLVVVALKQFFFENPKVADDLKKEVIK